MSEASHEAERIQRHLFGVEADLRRVAGPSARSTERAATLDMLHAYAVRGKFPRNMGQARARNPAFRAPAGSYVASPSSCPIFVDEFGSTCAVAYFMSRLGSVAVDEVVRCGNLRYLQEITEPWVGSWIADSGLTLREMARIQPLYCGNSSVTADPTYDAVMLTAAVVSGSFGLAAVVQAGGSGKPSVPLATTTLVVGATTAAMPLLVPPPNDFCARGDELSLAPADKVASDAALAMGFLNVGLGAGLLLLSPQRDVAVLPWVGSTSGVSVVVRW